MKSNLLAFSLVIAAFPAFAQEQKADDYRKSAFSEFRHIKPLSRKEVNGTLQKVQQHFPGMQVSLDKLTGDFTDIFGPAQIIPANDMAGKIQNVLSKLSAFGVQAGEWRQTADVSSKRARFINFEQSVNGHKIAFAALKFRFTNDGRLERITKHSFGSPANTSIPSITAASAKQYAQQDLNGITVMESNVDNNWCYFPVPSTNGYDLRPAYVFNIKGKSETLPVDLTGYIDGNSGEILYRSNKIKETINQTVQGSVYKQNPLLPATNEPLANLRVTIGGIDYYTDTFGVLNVPTLNAPISATMSLDGKWSTVIAINGSSGVTPSFTNPIAANGLVYTYPTAAPSSDRHVNAYYHVNRVHDFMKGYFPSFIDMDFPLPTNVDVTSGTCNAFYSGSSINFFAAGGGCNSFAECGDIIYHEYGHGISDNFYASMGVGTIFNGALNEGSSDVWGISITEDPVLGKGASPNGGIIRRYDLAPKVYPVDIIGEVHADGEIIAGAWWDVAVNLSSVDTMTQIFTDTYYSTPDGPDGTEGQVYHEVLIGALQSDDDDNNILNGTPHFAQIITAFARHGIYLLGDASITHTEIPNQPENTPVNISATFNVTSPGYFKNLLLHYRQRGGQWDSVIMVNQQATSVFNAQLAGQPAGTIIDYYMTVVDTFGMVNVSFPQSYDPLAAPSSVTIPYQFGVGIAPKMTVDFETPLSGWTVGNVIGDNATAGKWIIAKPVGSFLTTAAGTLAVQPNMDHTTGTTGQCLVTGNAGSTSSGIGVADVDGGKTTTITQVFDVSGFVEPVIEYWRWYSNNAGNNGGQDNWIVFIKDSASANWLYRVDYTKATDNQWRRRLFKLNEYLPSSTKFVMKFQAEDTSPSSTVEAAVDDIVIYEKVFASSVTNPDQLKASIYPNPATDEIHIRLSNATNGYIALYDLTGKQILMQNLNTGTDYSLNASSVTSGTYFVTVKTDKFIQSHKVVIMH